MQQTSLIQFKMQEEKSCKKLESSSSYCSYLFLLNIYAVHICQNKKLKTYFQVKVFSKSNYLVKHADLYLRSACSEALISGHGGISAPGNLESFTLMLWNFRMKRFLFLNALKGEQKTFAYSVHRYKDIFFLCILVSKFESRSYGHAWIHFI